MLKHYIILLIILTLFSLLSAGAPDTLWTRTYGGAGWDNGQSVQEANDGGFIITGFTTSFGAGDLDVYLIRTDFKGDTLWTKTFGGPEWDEGKSVQQTSDGGFIVAGWTRSFGAVDGDVYLIRTDSSGDTLWTKTYGDSSYNGGNSVQLTSDGGFVIVGWSGNKENVYLIKTNSSGDTLWTKEYFEYEEYRGNCVRETSDGGFIITGKIDNYDPNIGLIRTNSIGDTLWTKRYDSNAFLSSLSASSIIETSDKGFFISGRYYNEYSPDLITSDAYIFRTNADGDSLWRNKFGKFSNKENDYANSAQQTSDGGFIIAGTTQSFGAGGSDVFLIRTNSNGDSLWTRTYGGDSADAGSSIQKTSDGGFIIAGNTRSFGAGGGDVYLIRLEPEVGIQEDKPNNFINPNDFIISYNNYNIISIRYSIPYSTSVKLEAYDIKGKLVKVITDRFMHKGSYSVQWDSKRFVSGVYYIKLSAGDNTLIRKAVIIK